MISNDSSLIQRDLRTAGLRVPRPHLPAGLYPAPPDPRPQHIPTDIKGTCIHTNIHIQSMHTYIHTYMTHICIYIV